MVIYLTPHSSTFRLNLNLNPYHWKVSPRRKTRERKKRKSPQSRFSIPRHPHQQTNQWKTTTTTTMTKLVFPTWHPRSKHFPRSDYGSLRSRSNSSSTTGMYTYLAHQTHCSLRLSRPKLMAKRHTLNSASIRVCYCSTARSLGRMALVYSSRSSFSFSK